VLEPLKTARNVAIILAIAAAVAFIPGSSRATSTLEAVLWVGFAVALGYLGLRFYREHRVAIHGLGDTHRALLYGGVVLAVFLYAGQKRMWLTSLGKLGWFLLAGVALYSFIEVYRHSRTF